MDNTEFGYGGEMYNIVSGIDELKEDKKGTIYDKYEVRLLKPLLDIKTEYWNPNYDFVV